ncbi:YihY family inner membrane protein [Hydrogenovibrio thermophilus]|jgi:membrane protein|uniref:YihY family inner membrane protein n=1 Tax=Hydrogenovibrio thermophilus TaxID=265883 RepID=A0A410H4M5_9GAMM|nr:YihY family inner membrane protein [Hydrogenovibrio thermophilus]QAB15892.1 YihY family inner membrane protein [Hydrogenovibrio thermophilus]
MAETENRLYKIAFWIQAAQNFIRKDGLDAVTVLAYASLVGLVPFLTIMLSVFSMSDSFQTFEDAVMDKVFHYLLPASTPMVESYLLQFSQQASKLHGIGIFSMLVIALLLLWTIDQKINAMWDKHLQRSWWVSLLHYIGISVVGPVLLGGSLVLSSVLLAAPVLPGVPLETVFLNQLPILINVIGFWFLYRFVPLHRVPWRYALVGAILATFELELLKYGFGLYVKWFPTYNLIYGAFAVIPLFLLWLYLLWFILVFNASVVHQMMVKPKAA